MLAQQRKRKASDELPRQDRPRVDGSLAAVPVSPWRHPETCTHAIFKQYNLAIGQVMSRAARMVLLATTTSHPRWSHSVEHVATSELKGVIRADAYRLYGGMSDELMACGWTVCRWCEAEISSLRQEAWHFLKRRFLLRGNKYLTSVAALNGNLRAGDLWREDTPAPGDIDRLLDLVYEHYRSRIDAVEKEYIDAAAARLPVERIPERVLQYAGLIHQTKPVAEE